MTMCERGTLWNRHERDIRQSTVLVTFEAQAVQHAFKSLKSQTLWHLHCVSRLRWDKADV
jgi:hypothetical protein